MTAKAKVISSLVYSTEGIFFITGFLSASHSHHHRHHALRRIARFSIFGALVKFVGRDIRHTADELDPFPKPD